MKRITLITLSLIGLAACGGGSSNNPPNIAGTYNLTNTDCPGSFDPQVTVTQNGSDVVAQAANPLFFNDAQGSVDNDGNISASDANGSCDLQFINGVITGSCSGDGQTCQVTYTRQ